MLTLSMRAGCVRRVHTTHPTVLLENADLRVAIDVLDQGHHRLKSELDHGRGRCAVARHPGNHSTQCLGRHKRCLGGKAALAHTSFGVFAAMLRIVACLKVLDGICSSTHTGRQSRDENDTHRRLESRGTRADIMMHSPMPLTEAARLESWEEHAQ